MATATETETNAVEPRAKPPFLRRMRIRNYKSIAFCDVALEPLTLLVGRNASGKSNFLDALAFLAEIADGRISEAVTRRKGWRSIHHRGATTPDVEIAVEATLAGYQPAWEAEYSVSLRESPTHKVELHRERLCLREINGQRQCGYEFIEGRFEPIGGESLHLGGYSWEGTVYTDARSARRSFAEFFQQHRSRDRLVLSMIGEQPLVEFSEELRASGAYNFVPVSMRELHPNSASPVLESDGGNLARAIEGLEEIDPPSVKRVAQFLEAIVPGVEGFETVRYGEFETVQFRMKTRPGEMERFDAANMSDGTLRVLAALIAAYQIYLPTNASGFVAIEEPETSLHPAAMNALVGAFDEATLRKQILLTTHSGELLDHPAIRPENVRVVQLIDGRTVIAPVDEASSEIVRRNLNTLGGLERENQLQPDYDDRERQLNLEHSLNGSQR